MAFLEEEDYKVQIQEYELDELTQEDGTALAKAELMAQEEMQSYLRSRFDIGVIFTQTGNDRNPLLIMYLIDITLYHLFSAITPRNVPQIRMDRYDMAIRWLDKVRKGDIDAGLPLIVNTDGETNGTSFIDSYTQNGFNW